MIGTALTSTVPTRRVDVEALRRERERRDIVYWAEERGNFRLEDTGDPIVLAPHQRAVLRYCLNRREDRIPFKLVLWCEPKKGGKTTVAGMVAKWAAETWGTYGEILCVGNDAEQARERAFLKMSIAVEQTPGYDRARRRLPGRWELSGKEARCLTTGTRVKAIATDYQGEAGANPIVSIWTELWGFIHRADLRFWSEMAPSPTRPDSIRWVESYAGWEGESELLYGLYNQTVLEGRQLTAGELGDLSAFEEAPNADSVVPCYVNEAAGMFAFWDEGPQAHRQPWQNGPEGQAYYANETATQTPSNNERLHMNRWVSAESSFIDITWWDNCQVATPLGLVQGDNTPLIMALDAAVTNDCFGVVVMSRDPARPGGEDQEAGLLLRSAHKWQPTAGHPVNFPTVERTIREYCRNHNVVQIAYDPYQLHDMATRLTADGVAWCRPFGQGQERLVADAQLYTLIGHRRIKHDGAYPDVREHLTNANKKLSPNEDTRMRIVKKTETRKIDLAVCLSMASAECLRLML